ncbi:MAG TPA: YetF domain-containing protein [Thermoanaerobaculia bacterium]|jgi:uncharacterized membrane protein YcaP (DUF421 family)|nr:YetF domain-containing protein [Thermoanaerobaculia bacterium]
MFHEIWRSVVDALGVGIHPLDLTAGEIALRTALIYVFGLAAVRLADRRVLGKNTAFDVVVGVVLGSVLSRAINGTAPVFPTMVGVVILLLLHWLLAVASSRSHGLSVLLKGNAKPLIRDGLILWEEMRRNHISIGDLVEMLRLRGRVSDPKEVGMACLERNGEISAIPSRREPRVVQVGVREGVQTIRIEVA